jgi:hypothetical protein
MHLFRVLWGTVILLIDRGLFSLRFLVRQTATAAVSAA